MHSRQARASGGTAKRKSEDDYYLLAAQQEADVEAIGKVSLGLEEITQNMAQSIASLALGVSELSCEGQMVLAGRRPRSSVIIALLADGCEKDVLQELACCPSLTRSRLIEIGETIEPEGGEEEPLLAGYALLVRMFDAFSADTPAQRLEELVTDRSVSVRECLARRDSLPAKLLSQLAVDRHWRVRWEIAMRPVLPAIVVYALADDVEGVVRASIAKSDLCTAELLVRLAADPVACVRMAAATNSQLEKDCRLALLDDGDRRVRCMADAFLGDGASHGSKEERVAAPSPLAPAPEGGDR